MYKSLYLNLDYTPKLKNEFIVTYRIDSGMHLAEAACEVAKESSIGTWTAVGTLRADIIKKLGAKVFKLEDSIKQVKIAYPIKLFEPGNIPQLLSGLAGNIFSLKQIRNIRLEDIEFPREYIKSFHGPFHGIEGVRKTLKIPSRPILGCIMKPKIGLTSEENAELAYEVWTNGVDLVKDDENLTSLEFNPFAERVEKILKIKKYAEAKTKSKKIYAFNVTADPDLMLKRAKLVKSKGGECVMVDLVAMGLDNVHYLRRQNLKMIIHGHRAGHSAFSRSRLHGISMLVLAKLSRLAGIDQLHTGTVVGKMEGSAMEVIKLNKFLMEDWRGINLLRENWSGVKPIMPIASGGMHPGLVDGLVKILGKNLIINFGGGLHGHPQGSGAGARACKQAIEAADKGISMKRYATKNPELARALVQWK